MAVAACRLLAELLRHHEPVRAEFFLTGGLPVLSGALAAAAAAARLDGHPPAAAGARQRPASAPVARVAKVRPSPPSSRPGRGTTDRGLLRHPHRASAAKAPAATATAGAVERLGALLHVFAELAAPGDVDLAGCSGGEDGAAALRGDWAAVVGAEARRHAGTLFACLAPAPAGRGTPPAPRRLQVAAALVCGAALGPADVSSSPVPTSLSPSLRPPSAAQTPAKNISAGSCQPVGAPPPPGGGGRGGPDWD